VALLWPRYITKQAALWRSPFRMPYCTVHVTLGDDYFWRTTGLIVYLRLYRVNISNRLAILRGPRHERSIICCIHTIKCKSLAFQQTKYGR
jgi:hypothetical protein